MEPSRADRSTDSSDLKLLRHQSRDGPTRARVRAEKRRKRIANAFITIFFLAALASGIVFLTRGCRNDAAPGTTLATPG